MSTVEANVSENQGRSDPFWVRGVERIVTVCSAVAGVMIVLMAINIIVDFTSRKLLNHPLPGTLELVSYVWMPGLSLLALGYAQIRGEQIRVELIADEAKPAVRRVLAIFAEFVAVACVTVLGLLLFQEFIHVLEIHKTASIVRWVPYWPGYLMLVISLLVTGLAAAARLWRLFHGGPVGPVHELHDDDFEREIL